MSGYGSEGAQSPDNPCEQCGEPMNLDAIGYCCKDKEQEICLASAASDGAPCGRTWCQICYLKCARTVCERAGMYKHRDTKLLYCIVCARKINEACGEVVICITQERQC